MPSGETGCGVRHLTPNKSFRRAREGEEEEESVGSIALFDNPALISRLIRDGAHGIIGIFQSG